jgi:Tol biopolymer transport system component
MLYSGKRSLCALLFVLAMIPNIASSQGFGKNKVQYFSQEWSFIQSEHFDVYFYQNGYTIAEFVVETAEDAYLQISKSYNYELRDRVTIITYPSHNAFESTNVTFSSPEEGVGGFTEFFKNRIVIPYEGSYEQLRHVTHHELAHAMMLEMIYGGGIGSILSSLSRMPMPLWFIEGLAEYESRNGWDTDSDLFMRDGTINGYIPPINQMGGFLNYKGGQSVLYYISERYGKEKISELLHRIKSARDVERGFKLALGLDINDLSKRWHKWLQGNYWPTVAELQDPGDIARRLTNHIKDRNFVNNSPALSPDGYQLAFLSDRSDYFDIYLLSVVDGKIKRKLLSGQTSAKFEELHWLRPGLSWSPDGEDLVFASKAGKSDALHVLNVEEAEVTRTIRFDLDGIFSPAYSPDGDRIAFVGMKNGQSDIYTVSLQSGELSNVTDDIFSDLDPSWSPDGRYVAFISDRGDHLGPPPDDFSIAQYDYRQSEVYIADTQAGTLQRITHSAAMERTPEWSPRDHMISYVSDRDGVYNLYLHDLDTGEYYPITNLLTGCFQPTWSRDGGLAFASFFDAGYDIFYLRDAFDPNLRRDLVEEETVTQVIIQEPVPLDTTAVPQDFGMSQTSQKTPMGRIIFDDRYQAVQEVEKVFLDSSDYMNAEGGYKINDYALRFSPDIVYASAAYSTFFGLQAMGLLLFSDILGNHQIYIGLNVYSDLENANADLLYLYLPKRINYGIGLYHKAYFFYIFDEDQGEYTYFRDKNFGFNLYAEYPLSRYSRLEGTFNFLGIERDSYDWLFDEYSYEEKRRVIMPGLAYVHDTILWGSTGPMNGTRARLAFYASPNLENYIDLSGAPEWGLDFQTVIVDARKYLKIANDYVFAVRGTAGFSEGSDPMRFFVGGENNWINRRYQGDIEGDIEDIYFSNFITPFRGGDYYATEGTRFALMNLEFRYPLVRHLILGWPLPIHLANIRGALFMDTAGAWYNDDFRGTTYTEEGDVTLNDLMMGYGFGARVNLGIFLLRWDVAWRTYWDRTDKPRYYFSLGAEY